MTRTTLILIATLTAALALTACGDFPDNLPDAHPLGTTSALEAGDPIVTDWFLDFEEPSLCTPVVDLRTTPRGVEATPGRLATADVSGVEFTEEGWGYGTHCGQAYRDADARAIRRAYEVCELEEHRLAWPELLRRDAVEVRDTGADCRVDLVNWFVCH